MPVKGCPGQGAMEDKMRLIICGLLTLAFLFFGACSGDGDKHSEGSAGHASQVIKDNVEQINKEQASINPEKKPVEMPEIDTLISRAETILTHFCDQAVNGRVAARFIVPGSPEKFYLSDPLAANLNRLSKQLADGYSLRVETTKEPYKNQHGYEEAAFDVFIECGGVDELAVQLMYETKYDKFHEKKCWVPDGDADQ